MRESVGQLMLLKLVMIFIVLYVCILAVAVNYSITFRVKNNIVNIIEEYEGVDNALVHIEDYIDSIKYYKSSISMLSVIGDNEKCPSSKGQYCIKEISSKNGIKYKVTVYVSFNFPVVGRMLNFPISGDTKEISTIANTTRINGVPATTSDTSDETVEYINYNITFHGNGETSGYMEPIVGVTNKKVVLPENQYVKTGYYFYGWSILPLGAKKYDNKASFIRTTATDLDLYAVWTDDLSKLDNESPTCNFTVLKDGIHLNFSDNTGIIKYTLTHTYNNSSYNYSKLYTPAETNGSFSTSLAYGNYTATVIDSAGNTVTCSSPNITATIAYSCYVMCPALSEHGSYYTSAVCSGTCYKCKAGETKLSNKYCVDSQSITLDWNENGGNNLENGSCSYYGALTLPSKPIREGYTFNGWRLTDGKLYKASASLSDKCTSDYIGVTSGTSNNIVAKWCENCKDVDNGSCKLDASSLGKCTYTTKCNSGYYVSSGSGTSSPVCLPNKTITLNWDEAKGSIIENGTCEYNGDLTLPAAPTREGYKFTGWRLSNGDVKQAGETVSGGCISKYIGVGKQISNNIIKAVWEKSNITVKYNTNGGSNIGNTSCIFSSTLTLSNEVPTKEGYTFAGWSLPNGVLYKSGETVSKGCTVDAISIYDGEASAINAMYCKNCENVENGSCTLNASINSSRKTVNCKYTTSCDDGYYMSSGNGTYNPICVSKTVITIDYNENGGDAIANSTCSLNGDLVLASAPTREGYNFKGWKLADKSVKEANSTISGGCIKTYTGKDSGTSTSITAVWELSTITVDYNENGGNEIANGSCTYGKTLTLAAAPTREGYTFNGWKLADGTYQIVKTNVICNKSKIGSDEGTATSIEAAWCENCKDVENGSCVLDATSKLGKCTYTTKCNNGYYLFTGSGTNNPVCVQESIYIKYNSNGGTDVTNSMCMYSGDLTLSSEPSKTGYTFAGWKLANGKIAQANETIANGCNKSNTGVYKDISSSITAVWCQNCKTISNGSCTLDTTNGKCKYTITCNSGYKVANQGQRGGSCVKA